MCGYILEEKRTKITEVSANWLPLAPPFLGLGSLLAVSVSTAELVVDSLALPF